MGIQGVPSTAARAMSSSQRKRRQTTLAFWAFVGPMFIGLIVFTYIPIIWGLLLSFFEARRTVTPTQFVGLQNYITMINDSAFRQSLVTFALFALFIVPTTFAISLGLALLVNSVTHGQAFFRSVVWIGPPQPPLYWVVLVTVRLWLQVGFYMILFLAGLQEIPRSLYEAAYVDGASSGWKTFRHITFPLLRNTTVAVVLLLLIAAFQAFDEFVNILSGAIAGSSNINLARPPLVYLYQVSIGDQDFGRGSAGAFILAAIIIVVTVIQGRLAGFGQGDRE